MISRVAHPRLSALLLLPTTNLTRSHSVSLAICSKSQASRSVRASRCLYYAGVLYRRCAECASVWIPSSHSIENDLCFWTQILVRSHLGFPSLRPAFGRGTRSSGRWPWILQSSRSSKLSMRKIFLILGVFLFWWQPSGVHYNITILVLENI